MESSEYKFSFEIIADGGCYSFCLPTIQLDTSDSLGRPMKSNFVITSGLRHPKYAKISSIGLIGKQIRSISDFSADLDSMVEEINKERKPVTTFLLFDALISVCRKHIRDYGRLMYVDLLMYVDVFIYIDYAIFVSELEKYHELYEYALYKVLNTFPDKVLFVNKWGGTYSWADVPE